MSQSAEARTVVERQLDLLSKELDLIDAAIRQIDDITKGVKNWAIVTWTASVGVGLSSDQLRPFIWLTAAIPLLFWIVDGSYRRVQRSFILRQRDIARFVNSDDFIESVDQGTPLKFQLLRMRSGSPHWSSRLLGVMIFRTVGILYIGLCTLSLVAWLVAR